MGLHLLWGVATAAFAFPILPRPAQLALKGRWSRQLFDTLGVRLRTSGTPIDGGLFVANHISWLDIYAINAFAPAAFVSKDEVRRWPVIGWLSAKAETVFLERGSRSAAVRTKEHLIGLLRQRRRVSVFPEGTTGDGTRVLPFHGALFQSAIDAGVRVAPVAIRYTDAEGRLAMAPAYVGDITFWECFRAIARSGGLTAHAVFLPTLDAGSGDRRHLAHRAHTAISHTLAAGLTPNRWAQSDERTATETPGDLPDALPSASLPTGSRSPAPADSSPA
jgi:1-acyl-sn-glycerol-3-phosphate acyltransferase